MNISVIIPTLNEADQIQTCIQSLKHQSHILEFIIADAGSNDDTLAIAQAMGAHTVTCTSKGRGVQIRSGIDQARGDVILVLHADCRLNAAAAARAMNALNQNPGAAGGAFHMAFTHPAPRMKLIAFLNNLRAKLTGISFGDQGQFARTEALARIGGFPEQMLMEDIELSLRLKRAGRLIQLDNGVTVSARRWKQGPYLKRAIQILFLFTHYLWSHHTRGNSGRAGKYYRWYYGR